jgi:asparaginyl-tRNA synthetase|tara:strand:+ start:6394 stop:8175 length:1782 start_codon:yes stop_codon:yes gene_type:complete
MCRAAFDDVVDSAAREEARRRTTMRVSRAVVSVSVTRASSMVRGRTTTRAVVTAAYGRPERIARVKGRDGGASRVGEELEVRGWARSVRTQKGMAFIDLNDGSAISGMQAVVNEGSAAWEVANSGSVSTGAALRVKGKLVASPGGKQAAELAVDELEVIGAADSETYPLQKKRHTLEYLRSIAHLRPRTNTIGAVARVRNQLAYATHKFFQEHGFLYANTPIVTASDCEGAGEQFQVTTLLNGFAAAAAATPEAIAAAEAAAKEQGEVVKAVKEAKKAGDASKEDVDDAVAKLLSLKSEAEALAGAAGGASLPKKDDGSIDYSQDFFGKPSYLTVSGQLNGEIMACAVNDIYTFGPTFRAENSNTSRHLAEFWMVEPELAFADLNDDMDCAEAYLKYCLNHVLENCDEDLAFFEKNISKDNLRERLRSVATQEFARITYTEAVDHILNAKKKFEFPIKWGADLQSEHERYITEEVFKNRPVIVRDYPKDIKAFYMRLNDDNKTVAAMDVLVPRVGELMGGSQREERLDVLERRIEENGLEKESYWWYLDLRRYGSQPHAGFGLGFERLVCYVSGVENIRDAIPFPRYPGSAEF